MNFNKFHGMDLCIMYKEGLVTEHVAACRFYGRTTFSRINHAISLRQRDNFKFLRLASIIDSLLFTSYLKFVSDKFHVAQ